MIKRKIAPPVERNTVWCAIAAFDVVESPSGRALHAQFTAKKLRPSASHIRVWCSVYMYAAEAVESVLLAGGAFLCNTSAVARKTPKSTIERSSERHTATERTTVAAL